MRIVMIKRILEQQIGSMMSGQKAIIVMGPRQVGKSTLLETLLGKRDDVMWLNGDDPDVQR